MQFRSRNYQVSNLPTALQQLLLGYCDCINEFEAQTEQQIRTDFGVFLTLKDLQMFSAFNKLDVVLAVLACVHYVCVCVRSCVIAFK